MTLILIKILVKCSLQYTKMNIIHIFLVSATIINKVIIH
jgi:hypothetical protein